MVHEKHCLVILCPGQWGRASANVNPPQLQQGIAVIDHAWGWRGQGKMPPRKSTLLPVGQVKGMKDSCQGLVRDRSTFSLSERYSLFIFSIHFPMWYKVRVASLLCSTFLVSKSSRKKCLERNKKMKSLAS